VKLSLCMIVRDEAFFLADCLAMARPHVDEIVVVDTGSTDSTRQIAEGEADRVLDFAWIGDFSAARNHALAHASGDWILVLDADERIAPGAYPALRAATGDDAIDGYYLTTRNYTEKRSDGWHPVSPSDPMARGHSGFSVHEIMKLFRARDTIRYEGRVHEIVDGTVAPQRRGRLPGVVIHHYGEANPDRPRQQRQSAYLTIMEQELAQGEDARLLHHAGLTILHAVGDYPKAARYLRRAAELGYRPEESLDGAAEAHYRAGDFGPAHDLYAQLYASGRRSPALCLNFANLCVRAGRKGEGARLLQECLELGGIDSATDAVIRKNLDLLGH